MSELVKFAKSELRAAGLFDPDADFDGTVAPCVVSMMETFTAYGHSGGSAAVTLAAFSRLAEHKPLTPLTGEDSEWDDRSSIAGYPLWQNNRYHLCFKDKKHAWIVQSPSTAKGAHPGDGQVSAYISFPYTVE